MMNEFKIGDHVRMVQCRTFGVIVSSVKVGVGVDGGDRISVRWFNNNNVTDWHPDFLRHANTDPEDDPDDIRVGSCGRRREQVIINDNGVSLYLPEGFYRVEKTDDE